MIPLILRLKRAQHREIAKAQDIIIEVLYRIFDRAVLHGGTGIWRCYHGNRFSEDIDVYIPLDREKTELLFSSFEKRGFILLKKKIGQRSIYSTLQTNRTVVRFEAIFKQVDGCLKEYETVEGNLMTVYTLTPEVLIKEKVAAYLNRAKIRDLYDIFFLLRSVIKKEEVKMDIKRLVNSYKKANDEKELKLLILEGLVPESNKMVEYIKRWL